MTERESLWAVWRRVFDLAWPVGVEHTLRTLMRTTDVIVTGTFSPAAVAALGLADLYARFPLRIGLGLGGGAIALASQDTGSGAAATRDEAVTQALLLGLLSGLPFVLAGFLAGEAAIAVLGAPPAVARLGGTYLAVVFATAPARHVALVGARALQGTGDTRTPMYVNVAANALNIAGSLVFGLGLFGAPRYGILGVGAATAAGNVLTAVAFVALIWRGHTEAGLVRVRDPTIARQLVAVSTPRIAEGLGSTLLAFPFNSLLLGFGTSVNAAFQIGRRMYQQVTAPLARGYNVAASVLVGQSLGAGAPDRARREGWAVVGLGLLTVGAIGALLVAFAPALVGLFTDDAATARHATGFARTYGVAAGFLVAFTVFSGALQGASETRVPLVARLSGLLVCQLGVTYVAGAVLGYGALGAYLGVGLAFAWMAGGGFVGFRYTDWAGRAAGMMAERARDSDSG
ncbi:MAG: MATE family efflux transporter [Halobacteriaceae archaeon]